uniref:Uncharacterized protein n=1 Tax=Caenorhabditis japonica TaxID=281687 RepID=A0A8R1IDR0_CAEJA
MSLNRYSFRYLSNPNKFDTLDISEVEEYIQSGLSDTGLQIQQEALKLVEKALTVQNFKNRLNDILIEYRNDRAVGRYVRRLLQEEYTREDNESLAIVREMLASLQVSGNADEVRDCY